ncbi:MAG: hypothetical protein ACOY6K_22225 [Pseudomonadota bacterium]|jgi:hypothetical protein
MAEQRKTERDQTKPRDSGGAGHHLPPRSDEAPVDDTDRNTDRVITPPPPPDRTKGG